VTRSILAVVAEGYVVRFSVQTEVDEYDPGTAMPSQSVLLSDVFVADQHADVAVDFLANVVYVVVAERSCESDDGAV